MRESRRILGAGLLQLVIACADDPSPPPIVAEMVLATHMRWICPARAQRDECACRGANAAAGASVAVNSCENWIDFWLEDSHTAELEYDGACAYRLLEANLAVTETEEHMCSQTPSDEPVIACEDECQIYFGTDAVGDTCMRFGRRMSTCAADLLCGADGRCHEPCDRPLEIAVGEPCGYLHHGLLEEQCAAGSVCSVENSICEVPLASGERCDAGTAPCPADHTCEESRCEPKQPIRGACEKHRECITGVCIEGACAEADPWSCEHPWF